MYLFITVKLISIGTFTEFQSLMTGLNFESLEKFEDFQFHFSVFFLILWINLETGKYIVWFINLKALKKAQLKW